MLDDFSMESRTADNNDSITLVQFACGIFNFDEITKRVEVDKRAGLLALKQPILKSGEQHGIENSQKRTLKLHWTSTGTDNVQKSVTITKDQCKISLLKDNPKVFFIESDSRKFFYWIQEPEEKLSEYVETMRDIINDRFVTVTSQNTGTVGNTASKRPKFQLKSLFTRSSLIALLTKMDTQTKQRLIDSMPKFEGVEANETLLLECLTSTSCQETAELFQSLIEQGMGDDILKSFGYSNRVIVESRKGGIASFSRALEDENSDKEE